MPFGLYPLSEVSPICLGGVDGFIRITKGATMELHSSVMDKVDEKVIKFIETLPKEERDYFLTLLEQRHRFRFLIMLIDKREQS